MHRSTHKLSKNKVNVTIRISSKILQQAKDLGLNISKVTENALLQSIKALKPLFLNECSLPKKILWSLGRDLNPRPLPYQGNAQPTRPPRLKTNFYAWFLQFDMPLPVFMFSASNKQKRSLGFLWNWNVKCFACFF